MHRGVSVLIVGGGPVGLAAGLDAGVHGMAALVIDDSDTVSVGSRAVCYAKRSLEILNRWGCAERMVNKGVTWKVGKIFFRDELIRQFDLLPAPGHEQPAFINLQQYYLEQYMVERMLVGLLSKGHPLGATGIANIYEVSTHLRGEAGERQVEGARIGMTHVIGLGSAFGIHILEKA